MKSISGSVIESISESVSGSIPESITDHIWTNFILPEVCLSGLGRIFQTCHRFYRMGKSETLWQNKTINDFPNYNDKIIRCWLEYYQYLIIGSIPVILSDPIDQLTITLGQIFIRPGESRTELKDRLKLILISKPNLIYDFQVIGSDTNVLPLNDCCQGDRPAYVLIYKINVKQDQLTCYSSTELQLIAASLNIPHQDPQSIIKSIQQNYLFS